MNKEVTNADNWDDIEVYKGANRKYRKSCVSIRITNRESSAPKVYFHFSTLLISNHEDLIKDNIHLYYSRSNNCIIFKFIDTKDASSFKLVSRNINATLMANSFFNHYFKDSMISLLGEYEPKVTVIPNIGKCLYIELNKKGCN